MLPDAPVVIQSSESKPTPAEPIVHQVPHVIDRSTGQPLLVNIQPSQVANVVIPQGGTQALIFGDTSEPHISGQYFDDPSPYPESEVGLGFVGIQRVSHLQHSVYFFCSSALKFILKCLIEQFFNKIQILFN